MLREPAPEVIPGGDQARGERRLLYFSKAPKGNGIGATGSKNPRAY